MTTYRRGDMIVHEDWYQDGNEAGEQLWRLDFRYGEDAYQAQLFAKTAPHQLEQDSPVKYPSIRDEIAEQDEEYVSFRLFLERDNRSYDGGPRCDYAYKGWLTPSDRALSLLAKDELGAVRMMRAEIDEVAALPCDEAMVVESQRRFS